MCCPQQVNPKEKKAKGRTNEEAKQISRDALRRVYAKRGSECAIISGEPDIANSMHLLFLASVAAAAAIRAKGSFVHEESIGSTGPR